MTIWTGAILAVLFIALSGVIASFYGGSVELRNVLMILSVNLLANTLNMVPNALLMKEKRFRFAAIRSLAVQMVCGAAAIAAALCGMGIYALTINPVCSSIIIFLVNYSQHPLKPRFSPGMETLQKVFSFSAFQFGFQIINYFSRNLDKLLMGKYMSMDQLGYYDKSYRLMMMPLQNISYVISPVMHPVLAQIQDDKERIAAGYLKIVRLLAFIGFPLTVMMFFMAEDLVLFFFGPQWGPSVPAFKILSLTVGVQIISSSSGAVFQAADATRRLFQCGLFSAVTNITAICVGIFASGSVETVAACLSISFLINFIQCYHSMFKLTLKTGWAEFWKTLASPAVLAGILCLVLFPLSKGLAAVSNHFVSLVIFTLVSLAVCALYLQTTKEYDLIGNVRSLRKKS